MVAILGRLQAGNNGMNFVSLANGSGLCYSLKVADEQFSLPVAVGPAPRGKWEAGCNAGSLGQVRQ